MYLVTYAEVKIVKLIFCLTESENRLDSAKFFKNAHKLAYKIGDMHIFFRVPTQTIYLN